MLIEFLCPLYAVLRKKLQCAYDEKYVSREFNVEF